MIFISCVSFEDVTQQLAYPLCASSLSQKKKKLKKIIKKIQLGYFISVPLCSEYFYMVFPHGENLVSILTHYYVLLEWIQELNLIYRSVSQLKIFSIHSHLYSEYVVMWFFYAFGKYCVSVRDASFPAQL